jgi:hypothetical protein
MIWTGLMMTVGGIYMIGTFFVDIFSANTTAARGDAALGFILTIGGLIIVAIAENAKETAVRLPSSYIEMKRLLNDCESKWGHWPEEYRACKCRELDTAMIRIVNQADLNQLRPEYLVELNKLSDRKNQIFLRAA